YTTLFRSVEPSVGVSVGVSSPSVGSSGGALPDGTVGVEESSPSPGGPGSGFSVASPVSGAGFFDGSSVSGAGTSGVSPVPGLSSAVGLSVSGVSVSGVSSSDASASGGSVSSAPDSASGDGSAAAGEEWGEGVSGTSARAGAAATETVMARAAEHAQKRARRRMGVAPSPCRELSSCGRRHLSGSDGARYPTDPLLSTPSFPPQQARTRGLCTITRPPRFRTVDHYLT